MPSAPEVTILICDDDEITLKDNLRITQDAESNLGIACNILTFENGQSAFDWINEHGHAKGIVLLTDGSMPEMNGWQLLSTLQAQDLLPKQAIVCAQISSTGFSNLASQALGVTSGDVGNFVSFCAKDLKYHLLPKLLEEKLKSAFDELSPPRAAAQMPPPGSGSGPGPTPR